MNVSQAARIISERVGKTINPRDITQMFYRRELRDDLAPVIDGRRIIPENYLDMIQSALKRHSKI